MKSIILLFFILMTGCTTAMYQGDRQLSEVAKITSKDTTITAVDGVSVPYSGGNFAKILVLPGERKLDILLNKHTSNQSFTSPDPLSIYIKAEAGGEYETNAAMLKGRWFPIVIDLKTSKPIGFFKKDDEVDKENK